LLEASRSAPLLNIQSHKRTCEVEAPASFVIERKRLAAGRLGKVLAAGNLIAPAFRATGGLAAMQTERIRQTVSGPLSLEDIEKFQKQGWTATAIEWQREVPGEAAPGVEGPPYGLRVGDDCMRLEEDPDEARVLVTMMELMIQDGPYSSIAQELNRRGFATREGSKWNPVSVFKMLPRLIEAGPKIFSSEEWKRRRQQVRERKQGMTI
jgi:hypothetical protein